MSDDPVDIAAARNERTDIGERLIWISCGGVAGVLGLCGLLVWWLYPQSFLDRTLDLPLPVYPAPRLQTNPAADMQALRAAQLRRLASSGWVDESHGIVHIPIEAAMGIVAKEGISDWPASAPADASGDLP